MRERSIASITAVVGLWAASAARADEWAVLGPRAMGMGGAGVALTRGGLSTYWNPAALAPPHAPRVDTPFDIDIPATANAVASNDVLRDLDEIADIVDGLDFGNLEQQLNAGTPLSDQQLRDVLRLIDKLPGLAGEGVLVNASAAIAARAGWDKSIGAFGFSALGLTYAGGLTKVDLTNIALGDEGVGAVIGAGNDRSGQLSPAGQAFADSLAASGVATQNQAEEVVFQAEQGGQNVGQASTQQHIRDLLAATAANAGGGGVNNFLTQNQTGADVRGILLQEYALAYAHPFFDIFSLGVSGKLLYGTTYFKPFGLDDFDDVSDIVDDLFHGDNQEESFNWGIDAGLLIQPVEWLSIGVIGRNLNQPEFEFAGPGDYEVKRQVRAGVGVTPISNEGYSLNIAADVDIIENESEALPGYHSRVIGGGAEVVFGDILALRAGVSKNLSESAEDFLIHAGLGFRFWLIQIDAAAAVTPDSTEITFDNNDPKTVPERAGLSLMVSLNIPLN